jgi:hypothetical protein
MSPSIDVGSSWMPIKKYIENEKNVKDTDEEHIYADHYDPDALHDIRNFQHNIAQNMEKPG